MQDLRQILTHVLTIIGYTDDKTRFINDFISLCQKQASASLVAALPQETQEALAGTAPDSIELRHYFSDEAVEQAIKQATQTYFQSYLQTVAPTLSNEQRTNLQAYLSSLAAAQ